MKIQKKKNWGGGGVEGVGRGGQGGCEHRIEVFGKIHTKKDSGGGREGGSGGGSGWLGVRMDVNAMLGVGVDVGYEGCEPRIEGIVQCTKRYCTILRKLKKKCWGRGRGNI